MFDVASCNLWRLQQQEIFLLKYFSCSQSLQLSKWQLPSICTVWDTGSTLEILKQEILHNNFCQQHDHAAVLNHIEFKSFSSHIMQVYVFVYIFVKLAILILFLLSSAVMFFLYFMLNTILKYGKIVCEIDELIASQHDPSNDVMFLDVHSEYIFHVVEYFFSQENYVSFGLLVSYLSLSQSAQILLVNLLWGFS